MGGWFSLRLDLQPDPSALYLLSIHAHQHAAARHPTTCHRLCRHQHTHALPPSTMKFASSVVAVVSLLSAAWAMPTNSNYTNKLPTCGAVRATHVVTVTRIHANQNHQNECLTDGYFDGCAPGNLVCLCNLDQPEVDRYVKTVQPCLDGPPGKASCTAGAVASTCSTWPQLTMPRHLTRSTRLQTVAHVRLLEARVRQPEQDGRVGANTRVDNVTSHHSRSHVFMKQQSPPHAAYVMDNAHSFDVVLTFFYSSLAFLTLSWEPSFFKAQSTVDCSKVHARGVGDTGVQNSIFFGGFLVCPKLLARRRYVCDSTPRFLNRNLRDSLLIQQFKVMRQVYNIPSRAYDPPPLAPISSSPSLVLPAVPSPAVMDSTSCMVRGFLLEYRQPG